MYVLVCRRRKGGGELSVNGSSYRVQAAAAVSLRDRGAVHACHSLCLFTASLPLCILLSVSFCLSLSFCFCPCLVFTARKRVEKKKEGKGIMTRALMQMHDAQAYTVWIHILMVILRTKDRQGWNVTGHRHPDLLVTVCASTHRCPPPLWWDRHFEILIGDGSSRPKMRLVSVSFIEISSLCCAEQNMKQNRIIFRVQRKCSDITNKTCAEKNKLPTAASQVSQEVIIVKIPPPPRALWC